jgi:3',5'-cyclic AMP phosphodiesterase CpdA
MRSWKLLGLGLFAAGLIATLNLLQPGSLASRPVKPAVMAAAPVGQVPLLRFVATADSGTGGRGQYAVARSMEQYRQKAPYRLALLAGDNIYNEGEMTKIKQVFEKPYAPLLKAGVQFRAVLGNHDIRTENGWPQVRYPGFNMGGRWYSFREGPVQFFGLDTNVNADWKTQVSWLEQQLKQSQAPWKIVFGHHPIYSSGHYGTDPAMVKRLSPLFRKYGVQLYINGHDHHYERSKDINGTSYLIVGAGAGTRPVGWSPWTRKSASQLSFSAIEVWGDRLRMTALTPDGKVLDQGTIARTSAAGA